MLVTCLFPGQEPQLYVAVCALGAMAHWLVSDVPPNSAHLPFARAGSFEPRSSPSCRFRCLGGCRQWLCPCVHGRNLCMLGAWWRQRQGFCHQHENEPREIQMNGSESPNSPKDHLHPLRMPKCCLLAEEQEMLWHSSVVLMQRDFLDPSSGLKVAQNGDKDCANDGLESVRIKMELVSCSSPGSSWARPGFQE